MNIPDFAAIIAHNASWLQWTLWGLLMSLIMGWIAQSRGRPRPGGSAQRLQHPTSTLIIGLAGFLLFGAIAVISNVLANATTTWWTTAIFVGFALLALPILGDYFAARHEFLRKVCATAGCSAPVVLCVGRNLKASSSVKR